MRKITRAQFTRKPGGRKTTPAARLLSRALELLRNVTLIRTERELRLAREVVALGEMWKTAVQDPLPPPRPDAVVRQVTCLMWARSARMPA